jgi:hypothetical protein
MVGPKRLWQPAHLTGVVIVVVMSCSPAFVGVLQMVGALQ